MNAEFSFNLVNQPWIPCLRDDTASLRSLRSVLAHAHEIKAIVGDTPLVTGSLHRFLLAVLHRVFGPEDEKKWLALWTREQWDVAALDEYLDQWQHRFDLFDPAQPFYQAPDKRVQPKSVVNLQHDRASGNNPTLFDHHTEQEGESLTPAQAARALITAHAYGLAGLSGIAGRNFTDGTGAGGILFLVEGDTLKQTLLLNMIQYPPETDQFTHHSVQDAPAWEMADPLQPDRNTPFGYLDYLTWQNRRILLIPEQDDAGTVVRRMSMGPALSMGLMLRDPMKNYRRDEKLGLIATSFSENRVLWRDSATLFALNRELLGKAEPPTTLTWLGRLMQNARQPAKHMVYRTLALGMAKKQAKVFFLREERLPLPLAYLTDVDLVSALHTALQRTGTVAFDLLQVARLMGMYLHLPSVEQNGWQKQWQGLNVNAKNEITVWIAHTGIERNYWSRLEIPFQSLIVDLAEDEDKAHTQWDMEMRRAASATFDQAAEFAGSDARSLKAVVRSRSYLEYRLNEVIPVETKIILAAEDRERNSQ